MSSCNLHFRQNDRDRLRGTAVTQGRNGYQNKGQHTKLNLEKKILIVGRWYVQLAAIWHWYLPLCIYITFFFKLYIVCTFLLSFLFPLTWY